MKTYLDCLPCFMNQALKAARVVTIKPVIFEDGNTRSFNAEKWKEINCPAYEEAGQFIEVLW